MLPFRCHLIQTCWHPLNAYCQPANFSSVRSLNPHNDSVMEVVFIPTWPQRKRKLKEAKLAAEFLRTSKNTGAAFVLLQVREHGSALEEPKKNWFCPNMEDFYPAMNVTIFGDIAMKEEMLLIRGLSGGLSFNMTGVLRRRGAWTHEQIPEENMHRAKAMGTQLEGGICKPRSPNLPTPVSCTFSVQNCRKTVCCLSPPRLCYLLWQPPENQCLFFPYRNTSLIDTWLPLKYDNAFHWICLVGWHHGGRRVSDLLWVGSLFQKVLLPFPQHGLNCLLASQHRMSESAR